MAIVTSSVQSVVVRIQLNLMLITHTSVSVVYRFNVLNLFGSIILFVNGKGELGMYKTITVAFYNYNNEKEYSYFTDLSLKKDDLVVVESKQGYAVATVIKTKGLTEYEKSQPTKWVVCLVDAEAHLKRMKQREVVQELYNKLDERKTAIERTAMFEILAEKDPETKKLLDQLKEIDPDGQLLLLESTKEDDCSTTT